MDLLAKSGERATKLLDSKIRNVTVDQVQADEVWAFVWCKQKNVKVPSRSRGDQYTFVAIDRTSKLVLSHVVGKRTAINTES